MQFNLSLFGIMEVTWAGRPITFATTAARALLAYLAVEGHRPHAREKLAALLWPDQGQAAAYANLRQTLARVRKALPAESATSPLLNVTSQTMQCNQATAMIDVVRFERLVAACAAHPHPHLAACADCLPRLQQAAALYRGELLQDLFLAHSQPFDEWLLLKRDMLHRQAMNVLHVLTQHFESIHAYEEMRAYASRQLALEPWHEVAHAQVMRALAYAGQRAAALAQWKACYRVLQAELGVEPSSELSQLHEQIRTGQLRPAAVRDVARPTPRHNLPAQLTNFVGREQELANLQQLLTSTRLVTLIGAGGSGKTRLALEVANQVATKYADGVWLIELAPLTDPALVAQTVALRLRLHITAEQPISQLLVQELSSRHMLLVLDNCEHVVEACRQLIEHLLPACPELTVLATSREVLGLIGEHVRQVPPLSLPDPQQVAAPELLVQSEALRLFVERAGAASPGFALTPDNAWAVAQICQRLDGIPLALELAAARVRFLSVETIVARLDDRFHLLTSGKSAVLSRHQTLRSTVDWSYDLLSEPERIVFRQLGVFVGGFTLQAAEAIAAVDALGVTECVAQRPIIALLAQLADKSLLLTEQQGKVMRYRLLETMRAYTQEKLMTAGEMDTARDKHLAFFVQMAEEAERHLFGADQLLWFDRLEADHENLRAAMDWALERMNADAALRMVAALRSFWFTRGHYSQGRAVTLQSLALPSAQQHTHLRAKALNAAGALMWTLGDGDTALPLLEEALLLSQELDDRENLAWAKLHIGTIAYQQNDYVAARPPLETGLAICRQLGPMGRRGVGWAQIFLGDMALQEGDQAQAQTRYAEAVILLRELSDHALLAYPLRRLGQLATQRGNFHAATTLCKESLSVNQAIGDQMGVAASLAGLVGVAAAAGLAQGVLRSTEYLRYAALLAGAVACVQEQINTSLFPADASIFERSVAAVQAQIGEVSFALAWAEGHAMSLEQVFQVGDELGQTSLAATLAAPFAASVAADFLVGNY